MYAAKKVMDKMKPPLKKDDAIPSLCQWLNYVRLSQTVLDSIMALDSQSKLLHEARYEDCIHSKSHQLIVCNLVLKYFQA